MLKLKEKPKDLMLKTHETCLSVLKQHSLKPSHPLFKTHHLIEHTNEDCGDGHLKLVP